MNVRPLKLKQAYSLEGLGINIRMRGIDPKSSLGTFTLSFDFELGWGCTERGLWVEREKTGVYDEMRVVLPKFLAALDEMEFPATWAVVGAMIHDPSKRDFTHLPDAAKRIVEHFNSSSNRTTNDGRDLMDFLLNTRIQHRIACHSYSHVRFNFDGYLSLIHI